MHTLGISVVHCLHLWLVLTFSRRLVASITVPPIDPRASVRMLVSPDVDNLIVSYAILLFGVAPRGLIGRITIILSIALIQD
jgi:hypothetical protein